MKKIIGIVLIALFFILLWVGLSFVFYSGGINLWLSIIIPPCCYIEAALLIGFLELVTWLLK
jgi:hypothetical protein